MLRRRIMRVSGKTNGVATVLYILSLVQKQCNHSSTHAHMQTHNLTNVKGETNPRDHRNPRVTTSESPSMILNLGTVQ
jgi:hypothetical protein